MNDITSTINSLLAEAARLEALEANARAAGLNIASMRHYEALRATEGEAFNSEQAQEITGLTATGVSQLMSRLVNANLATRIKVYKGRQIIWVIN